MEKKVKFLKQSLKSNGNKINTEQMNKIALEFSTKIKLKLGWNLFQEGDIIEYLYLIKKGELQLSKEVDLAQEVTNEQGLNNFGDNNRLNGTHLLSQKNLLKYFTIEFGIVACDEFVGSEDIFMNKKYHTYTAKCLSDITVYIIKKSQLHKLIHEIYFFKIALQQYALSKYQYHQERVQQLVEKRKHNLAINLNLKKNQQIQDNTYQNINQRLTTNIDSDNPLKKKLQRLESIKISNLNSSLYSIIASGRKKQSLQKNNSDSFYLNSTYSNYEQQAQDSFKEIIDSSNTIISNQVHTERQLDWRTTHIQQDSQKISAAQQNNQQNITNNNTSSFSSKQSHLKTEHLSSSESIFKNKNFINRESESKQQEPASTLNTFWFDQTIKSRLSNKINQRIKEKDPAYLKSTRSTFKGNIGSCRFGQLDKKIKQLILSKPNLVSTALNRLNTCDSEDEQSQISPKIINYETQDKQICQRKFSPLISPLVLKVKISKNVNSVPQKQQTSISQTLNEKIYQTDNSNMTKQMVENNLKESINRRQFQIFNQASFFSLRPIRFSEREYQNTPQNLEQAQSSIDSKSEQSPKNNNQKYYNISNRGMLLQKIINEQQLQQFKPITKISIID